MYKSAEYTLLRFTKGRAGRGECGSYRGISLLSLPGSVPGKDIERVQRLTEEKISEEQGGFRKCRGCVYQIFSLRRVVEKILANGKLYAAFMDLEKAYDTESIGWHCGTL